MTPKDRTQVERVALALAKHWSKRFRGNENEFGVYLDDHLREDAAIAIATLSAPAEPSAALSDERVKVLTEALELIATGGRNATATAIAREALEDSDALLTFEAVARAALSASSPAVAGGCTVEHQAREIVALAAAALGYMDEDVETYRSGELDGDDLLPVQAVERALARTAPIPMLLYCPKCGLHHIDEPDERTPDWTNPPHRSHLCHGCGCIWRPADIATEGVRTLETRGKADTWTQPLNYLTYPNAPALTTTATASVETVRTLAAGRIIDIMCSGSFDWRSRLEDSDFLESADWLTALAYADAALSTPSGEDGHG